MTFRTVPCLLVLLAASTAFGARLEVSPTSHDFGKVPLGQKRLVTLRVANEGLIGRKIPVKSSSAHFAVSDPNLDIPGKKSVSLVVSLSDKAPAGAQSAVITIGDGNDAIRVNVKAQVEAPAAPKPTAAISAPKVTISPTSLDFGVVGLNQSKSLTFTVSSPEGTPCTVSTSSTAGYPAFEVSPASFSLSPNQPVTVTAKFTAKVQLQINPTGVGNGKTTVVCGATKTVVDLKGATAVPKRFKLTVVGTGSSSSINGMASQDPQSTFGQVIGCNPGEGDPGICGNTVQAGAKVDMKGTCQGPGNKFVWKVATGSAAPCQGSTNTLCSFVINADTTLTANCSPK